MLCMLSLMNDYVQESLKITKLANNALSNYFFSSTNINILQKTLVDTVKSKFGYSIGRQSDTELLNVMNYVYDQHALHCDHNIEIQINNLNEIVIDMVLPMIITGVKQYLGYVKDASTTYTPMSRGKTTSIKGENSLSMKPFF